MEALLADLARYGVPLVGLNVFLQQLGLPIPAVPTMMVAGALAADGRIFGPGVFGISVLASVVADALWFLAGRRYGYPVLRLLCRVSLTPDTCVRQTEGIFERYGFYSLVVSKFVPGFSTVAPPVAGALRMAFGQFLLAAFASAALWVGAAMAVGLVFATQIEAVLAWIGRHGVLAALALLALLALSIAWKAVQRWRLARFVEGTKIEPDELAQALSHDDPPLVVDIGSRLAHESRPHLPGALLMDLDGVASHDFPRDRSIVFYCACPNEVSAKRATQLLLARGYADVRPLIGGLDGWMAAGLPVEPGVAPDKPSSERRVA
jgi:membrane protein DedA with SNARE-associated domain/rhodanese-related sulfurtransferase